MTMSSDGNDDDMYAELARFQAGIEARFSNNGHAAPTFTSTPTTPYRVVQSPSPEDDSAFDGLDITELWDNFPTLNPVVIDKLLRRGEVANVISSTKAHKSWAILALALAVVTGGKWLDTFQAACGRVLIVDNELHRPTFSYRSRRVAEALGIDRHELEGRLRIVNLRGQARDVNQLRAALKAHYRPGDFTMAVLDAMYKAVPAGVSENENSGMSHVYDTLDGIAADLDAAVVAIHHSSKGDQSQKNVTDVGSGAGSVSRSADTRLIVRQHEEPDCVVLEGVMRSFAPIRPLPLRWAFPLWVPADDLDPEKLKRPPTLQSRQKEESEAKCLAALDRLDPNGTGASVYQCAENAGVKFQTAVNAFARLHLAKVVEHCKVPALINGTTRQVMAVRRIRPTDAQTF
jgi:hypothetical protein